MSTDVNEFLQRLKQRKLVQWAVAYVAGAFALLQGIDIIAHQFGWSDSVQRGCTLALVVGFFIALVVAWYHGERGEQRVSGMEIMLLALLLAIGGGLLWAFSGSSPKPGSASIARAGAPAGHASTGAAAVPAISVAIPAKSIAVLPFENLSADKGNGYFASGMQDVILARVLKATLVTRDTRLAKAPGLKIKVATP